MIDYENQLPSDDTELELMSEIRRWIKAREDYADLARKAEKMYACDETTSFQTNRRAKLNIFWSIVNTLKPAIYAQAPRSMVARRYPNRDIVARLAAQILERCTEYNIERGGYDVAVSRAVDDYLIAGQGTVWVRYEPTIKSDVPRVPVFEQPQPQAMPSLEMSEDGQMAEAPEAQEIYITQDGQQVDPSQLKQDDEGYYIDGEPQETLTDERVIVDYVHWSDFLFEPSRTWAEVSKVARKIHISKDEFIAKFGEEIYNDFSYARAQRDDDEIKKQALHNKICIFEVWDKTARKVVWLADGYNKIIKEDDPYLTFDGFFPCPPPLFSTLSPSGLVPRPDIVFYEDQQETLHYLCSVAQDIARYIKIVSIGDAARPELINILGAPNGTHINLTNFGQLIQNGGIKASYEVLSMADHAAILNVLYDSIEREKQQIYDITGISDIVRGVSNANETLGAQQLKSQYSNSRISEKQRKVSVFCRDVVQLIAEVIKNHFNPKLMLKMSGVPQSDPDVQEYMLGVIDLLRNDAVSDFKIEIETDSTKFVNIQDARQSALELTNALANLFNGLLPHTESIPQLVPVISELVLFTSRQFEAGRQVEGKLEQALEEMEKTVEENRQRQIEQQQQEMQLEQQKAQQAEQQPEAPPETQVDETKIAEMQLKAADLQSKQQLKAAELQAKQQLEAAKIQSKEAVEAAKIKSKEDIEAAKIIAQTEQSKRAELSKIITAEQKNTAELRKRVML